MNCLRKSLHSLAAAAEQAAGPKGPWQPDFHLVPPVGWLNDPNGLCRFRGEYHVFFQYTPFEANCGLKFWGHVKSQDLLRWEQCPVMLCPDTPFDLHGVYSGSALCEEDGLYLYYTGNVKHDGPYDYIRSGRESNTLLAYSPDGIHLEWKRLLLRNEDYPAGLTRHVRDPKVWKQEGRYYMLQGARTEEEEGVALVFASGDRLHWEHINTLRTEEPFGYMWECPDLVELNGRQFLLACPQGAAKQGPGFENPYACGYFPLSGDFRGECSLGELVPLDWGFDFYAPQTFLDGKRCLLTGWLGMPDAEYTNPTTAYGWQHCLTVPREVTCAGDRLQMQPAAELEALRGERQEWTFSGEETREAPAASDILITCEGSLSLDLSGACLRAEPGMLTLTLPEGGYGRTVRTAPVGTLRNLRILADVSALEIFVNDGETVLSTRWYPEDRRRELVLRGTGRAAVYEMKALEVTRWDPDGKSRRPE